ncbi:MAG: hypothetical protein SGJ20_08330 [Planctomycetota bacterium]|nr:hypothetical protein [Planctomycetota bacterium]
MAVETNFKIRRDMITPKGQYYEASVPDTLDLAERGKLAVHGLTNFLNEKKNYEPYGHGFFNTQPVYLTTRFGGGPEGGGAPNWGKIYDALVLTRMMSGSQEYLDVEEKTFNGMIQYIRGGNSVPTARVMMALMSLNQQSPDPELEKLTSDLANSLRDAAKVKDEMAWYYDFEEMPARMEDSKLGVLGHGWQAFIHGSVLRAFSRWAQKTGDKEYYELAGKMNNFLMQPQIWESESAPKAIVGHEHGQFMGHHHSYTSALMGILWYAEATGDVRLMQFVRDGYEYLRTFGIAAVGLFGEMCTVGDMTYLAVKLSELGVGDYWDDVDRYTRNQLVEGQVTDANKLARAAAAAPVLGRIDPKDPSDPVQRPLTPGQKQVELVPLEETTDNVCERFVGAYLSECGWPTVIPKHRFMMVICCSGNATMGLYAAWDGIVQCQDGAAKVNLLLNRASKWLDVDSFLPFEGKVVVTNKTAKSISVRMPLWVDLAAVQCEINSRETKPATLGRYLVFQSTEPNDKITITFPVVERQESYTLKWKKDNFWQESTNPGHNWVPDSPTRFTFTFRGNTVVDVSPRENTDEYKLYDRDDLKAGKAQMHKVTRFVSDRHIDW